MSNFSGVVKSGFQPRGTDEIRKAARGETELGMSGQVEHPNTDGVVRDLAAKIKSFYSSLPRDPRLLTESEKQALYEQIVGALPEEQALTEYGKDLARRLAGLESLGPQDSSRPVEIAGLGKTTDLSALREQILALSEKVRKWADEQGAARFAPQGARDERRADIELRKALANGKPVVPR